MQLMTMNKLEWHLNQNKINYLSKTKIFDMNLYNILNSNLAYYLNDLWSFCTTRDKESTLPAVEACRCLSKVDFWLIGNTIEVYKMLYTVMCFLVTH